MPTEANDSECMIAVFRGEVRCAVAIGFHGWEKDVAKWAGDPAISEVVRVPAEVARAFLFKKWPGRERAIAEARLQEAKNAATRPNPTGGKDA